MNMECYVIVARPRHSICALVNLEDMVFVLDLVGRTSTQLERTLRLHNSGQHHVMNIYTNFFIILLSSLVDLLSLFTLRLIPHTDLLYHDRGEHAWLSTVYLHVVKQN